MEFDPAVASLLISRGSADKSVFRDFRHWLDNTPVEDIARAMAEPLKDPIFPELLNRNGLEKVYDNMSQRSVYTCIFAAMLDVEALSIANNSSLGFEGTNNALLQPVADAIYKHTRTHDVVGRPGGDEFLIFGNAISEARSSYEGVDKRSTVELVGPLEERGKLLGRLFLGSLLTNRPFMSTDALISAGIIIKACNFAADTPWGGMVGAVDPKKGLGKGYNYAKLPESASLHRIYKQPLEMFKSIGYLVATSEGGYFVGFRDHSAMARAITDVGFEVSQMEDVLELEAKDVPKPVGVRQ